MSKHSHSPTNPNSWWFKDSHGKVVIAQYPNLPLAIWLSLRVLLKLLPSFQPKVVSSASTVVLLYWAFLELTKGESNFRKLLGGTVLVFITLNLARGLLR